MSGEGLVATGSEDSSYDLADDGNARDGFLMYDLRLYDAGQSPRSVRALENLRGVCDPHLAGRYRVKVVALLVTPRSRGGTRSSPYRPWCASSPSRSAGSSETSPTPTGCSPGCRSLRRAGPHHER